jgi:diguanylate cyclase (GGDEF)-like protein
MPTLAQIWSATRFPERDRARYAEREMVHETRTGVRTMSVVLLLPLATIALFSESLGLPQPFAYTSAALSALCAHVFVASRATRDLPGLHWLGTALVVISGSAFVLLAHETGSLGPAFFASVVMLFLSVPMVPWGLREALLTTVLVYGTFSISTWTGSSPFETAQLWTLQAFLSLAAVASLTLVARGTRVRKAELSARYDLEIAHSDAERRSLQDPLTGAWNRRYLDLVFDGVLRKHAELEEPLSFAALDIDSFKQLNDGHGHAAGDSVLCDLVEILGRAGGHEAIVVRAGGDEFIVVLRTVEPEEFVTRVDTEFAAETDGLDIGVSVGIVTLSPGSRPSFEHVYHQADDALYRAKRKGSSTGRCNSEYAPFVASGSDTGVSR